MKFSKSASYSSYSVQVNWRYCWFGDIVAGRKLRAHTNHTSTALGRCMFDMWNIHALLEFSNPNFAQFETWTCSGCPWFLSNFAVATTLEQAQVEAQVEVVAETVVLVKPQAPKQGKWNGRRSCATSAIRHALSRMSKRRWVVSWVSLLLCVTLLLLTHTTKFSYTVTFFYALHFWHIILNSQMSAL